ncbi:MAG: LemA family protein [Gemmatimonadales bacterium]|jgi:LemA protein|nr:LemA family protein [Gemmatimonadales bacterium]
MKRALVFTALVTLTVSGCGYNKIQTLDEEVNGYKGQVEVALQRRADLIPNLVNTVKGFAGQELAIFQEITDARSRLGGAIQGGGMAEMAAANQGLNSALGRLLAIVEDNPEIQSNENFRALQDQLEGTENRVATARMDYNNAVREYNAYIRRFPQVLTAKVIGAGSREYFEAEEGAAEAPKVEF